jgi:hypothetical protein
MRPAICSWSGRCNSACSNSSCWQALLICIRCDAKGPLRISAACRSFYV